jgi:hypothetical protein
VVSVEESTQQTLALLSVITGARVVAADFTESKAFYLRCLRYVQSLSGQAVIRELNTVPIQPRPPMVQTEDILPSTTPHAEPQGAWAESEPNQTL